MRWFRRAILALLTVYWITIFVLTHIPPINLRETGVGDKTAHVVGYFGLGVVLYLWLWVRWPHRRLIGLWVISICMAYGAVDELLQIPVGRHATVGDWIADTVGALLAVGVMELVRYFAPLSVRERTDVSAAPD